MSHPYQTYKEAFQAYEDSIESEAFAVWRRFSRFRPNFDVLSLDFVVSISALLDEMDLTVEKAVEKAQEELKKPVYGGFTPDDFGTVQLGKLVALKKGGLTQKQEARYRVLRDRFLGNRVVCEYLDATGGHGPYTPSEISDVAQKYGMFSERFYKEEFPFIDWIREGLRTRTKEPSVEEPTPTPNLELPDLEKYLQKNRRPLPEILTLGDIHKIDRYILDRL